MRLLSVACAALLLATSAHAASVKLAWDAGAGGDPPTGYIIYRKQGATGQYELLGQVLVPTTTFTDTNVPLGDVCYVATSYNSGGESSHSNEACMKSLSPSNPPVSLRFTP